MKLYLAGAIRDGVDDDIAWRQQVISYLGRTQVILSPLAGKSYHADTKTWRVHGTVTPDAKYIFRHDLWMVERADIVVANLTALASGYPSIGTLVELGAAVALRKLIYVLVDRDFTGHQNQAMYRLHPFLEQAGAAIFTSLGDLLVYLGQQCALLDGHEPEFRGVVA